MRGCFLFTLFLSFLFGRHWWVWSRAAVALDPFSVSFVFSDGNYFLLLKSICGCLCLRHIKKIYSSIFGFYHKIRDCRVSLAMMRERGGMTRIMNCDSIKVYKVKL